MHQKLDEKTKKFKQNYYQNMVEDLKTSNIGQWYSKLKRMSSIDPTKDQTVQVQTIMDLPSDQQAELIADQFAHISNLY